MKFFTKKQNNTIQCNACARNCLIESEQVGYCGVRKNEEGNLVLLNYGLLLFLKKGADHESDVMFVGSLGSNMRMSFDLNWDTSLFPFLRAQEIGRQKTNEEIKNLGYKYSPLELVQYVKKLGCKKIVFQFNEPIVSLEYILEVCKVGGVEVGIVTTGYFSKESLEKTLGLVNEISFYLFSTFDKFYKKHCDVQLGTIKQNIEQACNSGVNVKILCPLIPGENDYVKNIENVSSFVKDISPEIPLVFLKFFPSYRMLDKEVTSVQKLQEAKDIAKKVGLKNVDFVI